MEEKAIVVFRAYSKAMARQIDVDIEIPLDISANDLVVALNSAYNLGIDTLNMKDCYLKSENPIALLKGNKKLSDFGLRNASVIYYTE